MQTQFDLALPEIDPATSAFIKECYPLDEAQRLVRMSRTGFFRFRAEHGIGKATGKVHGAEVVRGLERVRGLTGKGPFPPLREYAAKLLGREEVPAPLRNKPVGSGRGRSIKRWDLWRVGRRMDGSDKE